MRCTIIVPLARACSCPRTPRAHHCGGASVKAALFIVELNGHAASGETHAHWVITWSGPRVTVAPPSSLTCARRCCCFTGAQPVYHCQRRGRARAPSIAASPLPPRVPLLPAQPLPRAIQCSRPVGAWGSMGAPRRATPSAADSAARPAQLAGHQHVVILLRKLGPRLDQYNM